MKHLLRNNPILRNIGWLIAERGLQIGGALLVTALIARALGMAGFGLFQYAQSLVFIASAFALVCGAEVLVPRLTRANQAESVALMRHALLLRALGAACGYGALMIACLMNPALNDIIGLCAVLGLSILLREPSGVVIAWCQARTDNRPAVAASAVALGAKLGAVIAAYAAGIATPLLLAAILAGESLIVALLLARHYHRANSGRQVAGAAGAVAGANSGACAAVGWEAEAEAGPPQAMPDGLDAALLRALAAQGLTYFIGIGAMMLFRRLDQLMLKDAIPLEQLGAYAAALQLADNYMLLATVIATAAAPRLVYGVEDNATARRNACQIAGAMGGASLVGGAVLALLAGPIITLIYGKAFAAATALLKAAALLAPLAFVEAGLGSYLLRVGRARLVAGKWLLAAFVAAGVNALAIPALGAHGALAGLAAGFVAAIVVNLAAIYRPALTGGRP